MKCIIRKGYAYYWLGRDRFGGEVVDITEEEHKRHHWIFEPLAYSEKVLAEPKSEVQQEEAVTESEQPEVQQEVVEEGIINNRAIIAPKTVRRKK